VVLLEEFRGRARCRYEMTRRKNASLEDVRCLIVNGSHLIE
jgi:hypothetical protein